MDDEVYGGCERSKLARTVATADWLPGFEPSWACPTCRRLAEVVLPALQMLERRVRGLERQTPGEPIWPLPVTKPEASQLETQERELLIQALREARGVQARAAASLGISPRTLVYKVRKFKLDEYCLFTKNKTMRERR